MVEQSKLPDDVDLVVVGSGAAGLTAAVTAAIAGATVLVLEKAELIGGTTALSGGGIWIPCNHHMGKVGVEDSREEALAYLREVSGGAADDELIEMLVDRGHEMISYLEEEGGMSFRPWPTEGGTLDYRPEARGAKHGGRPLDPGKFPIVELGDWIEKLRLSTASFWLMDKFDVYKERLYARPRSGRTIYQNQVSTAAGATSAFPSEYLANGAALLGQLLKGCIANGVRIVLAARAESLITHGDSVEGVRYSVEGNTIDVRCRHGVILASGGFGRNEDLKRALLSRPLEYTDDVETNEGDGLLMGMAVGAQIANISDAWWIPYASLGNDAGLGANGMICREERSLPHTIMVNQFGRRFVNEALNYYDVCEGFGSNQGGPRNLPAWVIFDQQGVESYNLFPKAPPDDDSWRVAATTLAELAEKLGIEAGSLEATVEEFNGHAREGVDPLFHRGDGIWDKEWGDPNHKPNPSLGPIDTPPFYAVKIGPGAFSTKGGLRVNARAEVLSAAAPFDPIPGLYAAGNVSAGATPNGYPGPGATLGAAMTLGYVAGRQVGGQFGRTPLATAHAA